MDKACPFVFSPRLLPGNPDLCRLQGSPCSGQDGFPSGGSGFKLRCETGSIQPASAAYLVASNKGSSFRPYHPCGLAVLGTLVADSCHAKSRRPCANEAACARDDWVAGKSV